MRYGETFPLLREAAGRHWTEYTEHAFTAGLQDGSLPQASFLRYLVQDYLYLIHYGRAWALAVTKADRLEDMRACARTVQALIGTEIELHVQVCAAAGISQAALFASEERLETIAYTRFVLDAGHSGDLLDLLMALAPCAFGYGEIGARIGAAAHAPTYRDWIETYASEGFQDSCREVGGLVDRAVAQRLGAEPESHPRWPQLCATFTTATRLESAFWQMGLQG
ncbi:MAG: TenA family protein [Cypionkella sp.]